MVQCSIIDANIDTTGFSYTLSLIDEKYKMFILHALMKFGTVHFNEFRGYIKGTSFKTLSADLKEIETNGLVHREKYSQVPPRVKYSLTETGRSLIPILDFVCERGDIYRG